MARSTANSPPRHWRLHPEDVQERASSVEHCKDVSGNNSNSAECSFVVGRSFETLARIVVYCDTGTIATGRVTKLGDVRYTFRKNVTSLDVIERCLRQPDDQANLTWDMLAAPNDKASHESSTKNLELIDMSLAILRGERDKLVQHVQSLELVQKQQQTDSTHTSRSAPDSSHSNTGMEFQFSLAAGPMKHVDQCLSDINAMGKLVRGVATNGSGTVFLYGNGGVAYTPNIPRALYHRLSQLRNSREHSSRPSYVSLGTRERYFVAFYDRTFSHKGPKGLDRELKKLSRPPRSVAFGSSYDAFVIVFTDGTWKLQGRGVPPDLEEKLKARRGASLACVNIGPSGEWFFRTQDGVVEWGGVSEDMNEAISELLEDGHFINFLDFGDNSAYFVSYD